MTQAFDRAVNIVLANEGLHNTDEGGDTWYGIARRFHPNEKPWPPTREQAIGIYRREYWDAHRCGELPYPLDVALFDAVVNQKVPEIVMEFQRVVRAEPDGVVGHDTIDSAKRRDVWETFALFFARRALRYFEKSAPEKQLGLVARLFRTTRVILRAGL